MEASSPRSISSHAATTVVASTPSRDLAAGISRQTSAFPPTDQDLVDSGGKSLRWRTLDCSYHRLWRSSLVCASSMSWPPHSPAVSRQLWAYDEPSPPPPEPQRPAMAGVAPSEERRRHRFPPHGAPTASATSCSYHRCRRLHLRRIHFPLKLSPLSYS